MKKKYILFVLYVLVPLIVNAQQISIHADESTKYSEYKYRNEKEWDAFNHISPVKRKNSEVTMKKIVYGWLPYWMGTAYKNFDYGLLTDVAYFSYEVNASTGGYNDIHYWKTTELIDYAHAAGVRVHLTATLFSSHSTLLRNDEAVSNLINNLVDMVKLRNADGINIDFEAMDASNRDRFTIFMQRLANKLHQEIPGSMLSIALPAVDWHDAFDVVAMQPYVDLFIIMGYDYHWSGSDYAGPVAPKNSGTIWSPQIDETRSVLSYLEKGLKKEKMALGVPYYGREWPVQSLSVPAKTSAKGTSVVYYKVVDSLKKYTENWDYHSSNGYYNKTLNGKYYQCWFDDAKSLGYKYDLVNELDIAGIGIWALGYDGEYNHLWNTLYKKFTIEGDTVTSGEFWDLGGPMENYFNNENYTFRIYRPNADSITVDFRSFVSEENNDVLSIYAGRPENNNLITSFTGNQGAKSITVSPADVYISFTSNSSENAQGWYAQWRAFSSGKPYVLMQIPDWISTDTVFLFNDIATTGDINKRFYAINPLNDDITTNFGYFADNFATKSDIWENTQDWTFSDDCLRYNNTAKSGFIYSNINTFADTAYLYDVTANINGELEIIFSENINSQQPYTAYKLVINTSDNTLQLVSVDASTAEVVISSDNLNIKQGFNTYSMIYSPIDMSINFYVNGILKQSVSIANKVNASYFGFQASGDVAIDKVLMLRERKNYVVLTTGENGNISAENINPDKPAYEIIAAVTDKNNNLSSVVSNKVNVDLSVPSSPAYVYDGLSSDIDTLKPDETLSANWAESEDNQSGLKYYLISVGTEPKKDDLVSWFNIDSATSVILYGFETEKDSMLYFNVKAVNKAGLESQIVSSDGIYYKNESEQESDTLSFDANIWVYPNPCEDNFTAALGFTPYETYSYRLIDSNGKVVLYGESRDEKLRVNLPGNISSGVFILIINYKQEAHIIKLIKR